jgi:hypothetical protein
MPKQSPGTAKAGANVESGISALKGGGKPLSGSERSFFEPRLGTDLSGVRVHDGPQAHDAANSINARAFTLGKDIAFAKGEYSPGTEGGNRLMAHELAHVMQRPSVPLVQRKILFMGEDLPFHMDVVEKFIKKSLVERSVVDVASDLEKEVNISGGIDKKDSASIDIGIFRVILNDFYRGMNETTREILQEMLASPRNFCLDGSSYKEAFDNLKEHIRAREQIIKKTDDVSFEFATKDKLRTNPEYWDGQFLKDESEKLEAAEDFFINPDKYAVGCKMAARATAIAGSGTVNFKTLNNCPYYDWVPGDFGWIINKDPVSSREDGDEGENLIYLGGNRFWGLTGDGSLKMDRGWWLGEVAGWGNKGAEFDGRRDFPMTGLIDCE